MSNRKIHVRVIAGAAALACAPFLAVSPAGAATGGWDPDQTGMYHSGYADADTTDSACTVVSNNAPSQSTPIVPNAAPTHFSSQVSLVAESASDPTNTVTTASTLTGDVQMTQAGGNPTGLHLSFKGTQSRTPSQATAPCATSVDNEIETGGTFTVTRPTIVTTDSVTHGSALWQIQMQPLDSTGGIFDYAGALLDWSSTPDIRTHRSFYMAPGSYGIEVGGALTMDSSKARASSSANGKLTISFGVPGTRTEQHKGSRYVKMPKSQSCTSNTISPKITTKHKLAKRIKKIRFYGPKVADKTVRHHLYKGRTIRVHASKTAPVDVNIRIRLRNGRVINATASYLQCS